MLTLPTNLTPEAERRYLSIEPRRTALVIRLVGPQLTESEAAVVKSATERALNAWEGRLKWLVFDIRDIHLMSSVGLGICIELSTRAKTLRAKTMMFGPTEELDRLFKTVGAHKIFAVENREHVLAKHTKT